MNKLVSPTGQLIATPEMCYPKSGKVDFVAYYPYTASVDGDYTIDVNVAGQASGLPVEVLRSDNVKNQAATKSEVKLDFKYSLAGCF